MTALRQKMVNALQLAGMSERTQQSYLREVQLLAQFHNQPPDRLTQQHLEAYLLHRKNVDKLAPASMRICYAGIKFFYRNLIIRDWPILNLIRGEHEHKLPVILSAEQVHRIIENTQTFHNRVYFATVYSCGLRLHEALHPIGSGSSCSSRRHPRRPRHPPRPSWKRRYRSDDPLTSPYTFTSTRLLENPQKPTLALPRTGP